MSGEWMSRELVYSSTPHSFTHPLRFRRLSLPLTNPVAAFFRCMANLPEIQFPLVENRDCDDFEAGLVEKILREYGDAVLLKYAKLPTSLRFAGGDR